MVVGGELLGLGASEVELAGEGGELVFEDVGEALEKDEGEDVVLELGGVQGSPNLASRIPQPSF